MINETLPDIGVTETMKRNIYVKLYDRNGELIAQHGDLQETMIDAKSLPKCVINAITDVEDKNFFKHRGIDFLAIIRSGIRNFVCGRIVGGGSTITQQLAKNILQNEEKISIYDKTILRKLKELLMAVKIEQKYDKFQILTFYLNRVYFGAGCFGIDAASEVYFQKSPKNLNSYESAALAGLVQAPSRFAGNKDYWKKRTERVLKAMYKNGHLSQKELKNFEKFQLNPRKNFNKFAHFTDFVLQNIPNEYKNRDLIVKTTIDANIQTKANEAMQKTYQEFGKQWQADQGAMVILSKNGEILGMIGSLNYHDYQFNIAAHSHRLVGSFFKFYVYLEAIRKGISLDSFIDDKAVTLGAWEPSNYLYESHGKIKIRDAFAQSVNSSAIMLLMGCGIKNVKNMAYKVGIQTPIPSNPSIALGGFSTNLLECTSTMLPIINNGYKITPYAISEIRDANSGEILFKKQNRFEKVLDDRTVWYMWQLLKYTVETGTGRRLKTDDKIIGAKTGTSNEYRDLWTISATSEYVVGAWFGRSDFKPMNRIAGAHLPNVACQYFYAQMPTQMTEIQVDFNFQPNTASLEDLMSL